MRKKSVRLELLLCITIILLLFVSCSREVERNLKLLDSKDAEVRLKAVRRLGDIGSKHATEPLIEVALDKNETFRIRKEAIYALAKIGDEKALFALERLRKSVLLSSDAEAAICLIRNKDVNSLVAEFKHLGGGEDTLLDTDIRPEVIKTLIDIGDKRSKLVLKRLIKESEDEYIRNFAKMGVYIFEQDIDSLLLALKYGDEETRDLVSYALGKIGEPAVDPLMELFTSGKHELVSDALIAIGEPAVRPLTTILEDKKDSDDVRERAIGILVAISDERVIEPLIDVLKDEKNSDDIRKKAISTLLGIGDERAIKPIINAARTDTAMHGAAASALGRFDYKKTSTKPAVDILIKFLKDEDSSVRFSAVKSLGNIGDERAVEPLITAHKDEDSDVRHYAAIALGRICSKRRIDAAVEVMLKNLKSDYTDVVYWAIQALEKISDKRALPMLEWMARGDDREYKGESLKEVAKQVFEEISGHSLKSFDSMSLESFDLTSFDTFESFKSLKGHSLWVRNGFFPKARPTLVWKVVFSETGGIVQDIDNKFQRGERLDVLNVMVNTSKVDDYFRKVHLTFRVEEVSGNKIDIIYDSVYHSSTPVEKKVQLIASQISESFIVSQFKKE